jgi:periplasmic protein TonB
MQRIRAIHRHGAAFALSLTCLLAVSTTKADGQREQFVHPSSGPPHEAFLPPVVPDYQHAPIPTDDYPPQAIRQHHEGTVDVLANLDTSGKVREATVLQSSGFRELDRAAMKTVQTKQFQPCTPKNRSHDKCLVAVPVVFHRPEP